jgi:hypothetical protein
MGSAFLASEGALRFGQRCHDSGYCFEVDVSPLYVTTAIMLVLVISYLVFMQPRTWWVADISVEQSADAARSAASTAHAAARVTNKISVCNAELVAAPFSLSVMVGMDGTYFEINGVTELMRISEVKHAIAKVSGVAPVAQNLVCASGSLDDETLRLIEYGIGADDSLLQVLVEEVQMWNWHKQHGPGGQVVTEIWEWHNQMPMLASLSEDKT